MQTMLEYTLLGITMIGMVFLVVRDFTHQRGVRREQEWDNRWLEQNRKLVMEVQSLRKQLDQQGQVIEGLAKQLQASRLEAALPREVKKTPHAEHLLLNDRYKEIFELHEQGLTPEQIAKKLQKGYGEIAFILDLAKKGD